MRRTAITYFICALAAMLLAACESSDHAPTAQPSGELIAADIAAPGKVEAEAATCCKESCGDDCANCRHCAKAPKTAEPSFHYSPFFVELEGQGEFDVITFKDVGLKRKDLSPTHPLLEVIAESLSYSIAQSELGYGPAMVNFDEALADPENHRACGQNHLYVDVWRTGGGTFGYSLWSGCGESDKFAWQELGEPAAGETLAEQVEPLTRSITESLAKAKEAQCFRQHC